MDCRWSRTPCSSARFRNCQRLSNHSSTKTTLGTWRTFSHLFQGRRWGRPSAEGQSREDKSREISHNVVTSARKTRLVKRYSPLRTSNRCPGCFPRVAWEEVHPAPPEIGEPRRGLRNRDGGLEQAHTQSKNLDYS